VGIVRELATIGLGGIAGGHGIEAGVRFTVCRKNGIPITAYIYMHVDISAEELKTIRRAGLRDLRRSDDASATRLEHF
jgi:hypothetical protein